MGGTSDSPEIRRISIDSISPSALAETNFRELDDVFLQTQTRIWLGEVLHTRLDEDMVIADLLADGKLLFQISKVVWKMLLTKCMELRNSKAYICEKAAFGKRSTRYMPYSNVDSFLKICQILGLKSIDLFSPSDVVEKKDSRRVCMCIRSLSKKARSKGLNVPDFDVVTYTLVMPTNLVGGLRRSLEKSQSKFFSAAVCGPSLEQKPKHTQKNWGADFGTQNDSYSEESDDAESSYNVFEFDSPASNTSLRDASLLGPSIENSLGGNLVGENGIPTHSTIVLDVQDKENVERPYKPVSSLQMKCSSLNGDAGLSLSGDEGSNAAFTGEIREDFISEQNYVGCGSGISNFATHAEGNTMFNLFSETNFHGSRYELMRSSSEEIEDDEVSSTGSLNSISGKVGTIDYDDQSDEDNDPNVQFLQLQHPDTGYVDAKSVNDCDADKSDAISNCGVGLKNIGVLRNMYLDKTEILPGQSDGSFHIQNKWNENHKPSDAIIVDENNGVLLPLEAMSDDTVSHSRKEVSEDNSNFVIESDVNVICTLSIDRDVKTMENLNSSTLSRDSSSNNKEIMCELDICSIESEIAELSSSLVGTSSANSSGGEGKAFSCNNIMSSLSGQDQSRLQEHLHVGKDETVTLINSIVGSSNSSEGISHLNDTSDICELEIVEMGSDVTSHDKSCVISSSSEHVGNDNSDKNNLQMGHLACTDKNKDKENIEEVDRNIEASKSKRRTKVLLKSVAGGVTLIGVFLLFQLRKRSGGEKVSEGGIPSIRISKKGSNETSRQNKQQGGKADKFYPGEKLKF